MEDELTDIQGLLLCRWARASIAAALGGPPADLLLDGLPVRPGACFVTLRWARLGATDAAPPTRLEPELQGCIGTLEAHRSLAADVAANAVAAALRDPRGRPLRLTELAALDVEVSVLGPLVLLPVRSEAEAIAALRPPTDGAVLRCGARRGTFLPQVWESLPEPREFLRQLKLKAGLPALGWDPLYQLLGYTVKKWQHPGRG
jgi:AmmeMemoRadiSam system protein A